MKNKTGLTEEELYGMVDENLVRKYQVKYLDFFETGPVLDIGCGRGIFLELLREKGIEANGVDLSHEVIDKLEMKGFAVYQLNAVNFLKNKKNHYSGIFCSHFIEHHSPEEVKKLISLCYRALKKNGVLVIITPNPQDIRVMTEMFWLDQTHVRPYPLKLLEQMFKHQEFVILKKGVDPDTMAKHSRTPMIDVLLKKIFSRLPIGPFVNTGHDIFIVGKKP